MSDGLLLELMLLLCCVLVGPERALRQAVNAGWSDSVSRVLPYLQRAALTPHLRDLARTHEVDLKRLRGAAAAATGTAEPEIAPLRRVRVKDACQASGASPGIATSEWSCSGETSSRS